MFYPLLLVLYYRLSWLSVRFIILFNIMTFPTHKIQTISNHQCSNFHVAGSKHNVHAQSANHPSLCLGCMHTPTQIMFTLLLKKNYRILKRIKFFAEENASNEVVKKPEGDNRIMKALRLLKGRN